LDQVKADIQSCAGDHDSSRSLLLLLQGHSHTMENANLSVIIAKYNLRRERLTRILHTSRLDGKSTIMAFLQTTPLECIPNPHGTSLEISRNFKEAICQTLIYEF